MAAKDPRIISANDTEFYAKFNDGTEHKMPNVTSYTENEGTTPTTQKATLDGVGQVVGRPQPGSLTINIEALPHVQVYQKIAQANASGNQVQFKFTTKKSQIATGAMASISLTGAVTFKGADAPDLTDASFSIGDALEIENKYYVINSIDADGDATVQNAPDPAIADKAWKWVVPPIGRKYFPTRITEFGSVNLQADDSITGTLTAQIIGSIGAMEVIS